jgi:hypothetical protein
MLARATPRGRLLGFDFGDWAVLFTGLGLATAPITLFA